MFHFQNSNLGNLSILYFNYFFLFVDISFSNTRKIHFNSVFINGLLNQSYDRE